MVRPIIQTLDVGDYVLKGHETRCIIERKGSIQELAGNLFTKDWARAMSAFERLSNATANPYLLLECTPNDLAKPSRWVENPEQIVDALASLLERFKLRLLLCGSVKTYDQKRTVGEFILRLMLAHAYSREIDYGSAKIKALSKFLSPPRPAPATGDGEGHV